MIVTTKNGKLRGVEEDGLCIFKGVPYAKPPVGQLRWKAPQPVEDWEGVRNALEFGNNSVQPVFDSAGQNISTTNDGAQGEDCLYLNIWAPASAVEEGKKLPVMVTVHGGGFTAFSGSIPILSGKNLAKEGLVTVNINYRLGILGFMAHPELSAEDENGVSGNYGILDQMQALRWVKENIEAFGGDPENVTVSGESAGSFSVSILCMSKLSKGLFQKAMAQSGAFTDVRTALYNCIDLKEAQAQCLQSVENRSLEELRAMSPEELMKLMPKFTLSCLEPVRDGCVFPMDPEEAFKDGSFSDVPIMIGSNREDGSKFHAQSKDGEAFKGFAEKLVGAEKLSGFKEIYPSESEEETLNSWTRLMTDSGFGHGMHAWADLQNSCGKSDVYLYYYCHVPPNDAGFGAYHSSELLYFLRNTWSVKKEWTETDYRLEKLYSGYIINFVKYGNPNGEGLPVWNTYRSDPKAVMVLDEEPHMAENPTMKAMEFWDHCRL